MRACSDLSTTTAGRKWRFCFFVLLLAMWRRLAWLRLILPVAVTLKRFLAPEWVFIFGILTRFLMERKSTAFSRSRKKTVLIFYQLAALAL